MRFPMALLLMAGLLLGGCGMFGGDSASADIPQAQEEVAAEAAPAAAPVAEKSAKGSKSAKSSKKADKQTSTPKTEAEIKAALDATGRKLAGQAARTVMPSKASKDVKKIGGEYVAFYVGIDVDSVTTEMRPSTSKGKYIGLVHYQEGLYECRGASKKAALSATCQRMGARNVTEMIQFNGKAWQY